MIMQSCTNAYIAKNTISLERVKSRGKFCLELVNALTALAIALRRGPCCSPTILI